MFSSNPFDPALCTSWVAAMRRWRHSTRGLVYAALTGYGQTGP
jgi:hypothetical protein